MIQHYNMIMEPADSDSAHITTSIQYICDQSNIDIMNVIVSIG